MPQDDDTPHTPYEAVIDSIRASQCGSKDKHETSDKADDQLEKLRRKYSDASLMHVYSCIFCNGYHIGNKMRRKSLIAAERYLTLENLLLYDFSKEITPRRPKSRSDRLTRVEFARMSDDGCPNWPDFGEWMRDR